MGLPHVRGGVSSVGVLQTVVDVSSPRAWGCFSLSLLPFTSVRVFPTCVGVFLCRKEPA